MPSSRLAYLVRRHYDQLCTAAETAELLDLLRDGASDTEMDGLLAELMEEHQPQAAMPAAQMEVAWSAFRRKTRPAVLRKVWRWSAAAALLAGAVAGGLLLARKPVLQQQVAVVADIAPATDKAVLTLADGSTVALDSAGRIRLQEQDASISQQGGLLEYAAGAASEEVQYNTLRTPRGGTFRIQLPDGTKVWLNAASSLRYPTAFSSKRREVEMTGEAYFEVKKDAAPFRVKLAAGAAVEVLGTHFNIAAYEDMHTMTATLTEGSVRVSQGARSVKLAPDEQAVISMGSDAPIQVLQNANTEQVLAWKNGLFHFDNVPFTDVMRQLSRWYDVDVEYRGAVPSRTYSGELQRGLSLQQILEIMKEMKIDVRLEEGRKLVVMP